MERVHVNYSAYRFGGISGRGVTYLAVQYGLGLLPERRPRSGGHHSAYLGVDGPNLTEKPAGLPKARRLSASRFLWFRSGSAVFLRSLVAVEPRRRGKS